MKKISIFSVLFILINSHCLPTPMEASPLSSTESASITATVEPTQTFIPFMSKQLSGYFVAPSGSDSNPGTILEPWKTIRKATRMVKPGDTVYIRNGIYTEMASFEISGTEANPIRIMAYPGENPIIDGGFNQAWGALLEVLGDYIYVSGIEVRNSDGWCIYVYGNHDVIDNVAAHHCRSSGIRISHGQYSTVQNSRIWRTSLINEYGQSSVWSTGLSAARDGVSYATIRNNIVWDIWGEGISTFEADHTLIEDNIVYDSFSGNIYISDSTNVLCRRNLVYTDPTSYVYPYSGHRGIVMGDEKNNPISSNNTVINNISFGNDLNFVLFQGSSVMNNVLIANNTFVNGINSGNVKLRGYHKNVRFENNIVLQDGPLPIVSIELQPDVEFLNNNWSKTPPSAASGSGDIIANPLLQRTGDPHSPYWFRLTGSSPAIDHAISIPEVMGDFFNLSRGNNPDMGAIEYIP